MPAPSASKAPVVVGIGASAGGFEAFTRLLSRIPADTGMAFIFIQHLDPTHESILTSLLGKATPMTVSEVVNRMTVKPNRVYVIPPNTNLTFCEGDLHLTRRSKTGDRVMPVDHFLESLAQERKNKAVGVVLSGTGSDGTLGLSAIKAEGGITFAQDVQSAKYDGMPRSAVAAKVVDFVLPPEGIADELVKISRHPYLLTPDHEMASGVPIDSNAFDRIFRVLRAKTGVDFAQYKRPTIRRRLERRMLMKKIDKLEQYAEFLHVNPEEVSALYGDLLITVTEFFREPKTFDALRSHVFPTLLKDRPSLTPIRVWVPGCSTGEEAYSIAIELVDFLGSQSAEQVIQIFGTDLSESAVAKARAGLYPESVTRRVSHDFLQRFFEKGDDGFRVTSRIRDLCVFARQDLTKDAPFSHIDLISCRNVLIYLRPELQTRILSVFHYSLAPGGHLVLGGSETVGELAHQYAVVNKTNRIYRKSDDSLDQTEFNVGQPRREIFAGSKLVADNEETPREGAVQREVDRIILRRYTPAGVVVNNEMEILQFRGDASPYLQHAAGAASLSLMNMARRDLLADLRTAVELARKQEVPVRRGPITIGTGQDASRSIDLEVLPIRLPSQQKHCLLILFHELPQASTAATAAGQPAGEPPEDSELARLERELTSTREYLQFVMDERQGVEEELRATNEEVLANNEELQSANEELETSQEELQSVNEELTTVNDELQTRNVELAHLGNDLNNLLNVVNFPIVMLGPDLRLRRFTPTAESVLNLRPSDVGRRFTEIKPNLDVSDMEAELTGVMRNFTPKEIETRDRQGTWYSMRIRPYLTSDNHIDGVVIVLFDIDELKRSLDDVERGRAFAEAIVETVPEPLVALDPSLRVLIANRTFFETFRRERATTEGKPIYSPAGGGWTAPGLKGKLEAAFAGAGQNFEVAGKFPHGEQRIILFKPRKIQVGGDKAEIMLLVMEDVTEQRLEERQWKTELERHGAMLKGAEASLRESEADLRRNQDELRILAARLINNQELERRRVSRELHDELQQKLAMLSVEAERVSKVSVEPSVKSGLQALRSRVDELLTDVRRVAYRLHPAILDHLGLFAALQSYCSDLSKLEGIQINFVARNQPKMLPEDVALCLYRVTQEGLRNVAKHSKATRATVTLGSSRNQVWLSIQDRGAGFDPALALRTPGIGLISMRERLRLVDGTFFLQSKPGAGTTIVARVPLRKGAKKKK